MAKRRAAAGSVEPPKPPTITPKKALPLLRQQVAAGDRLCAGLMLSQEDFSSWFTTTRHWLEAVFGVGSPKVAEVMNAGIKFMVDVHASELQHSEDRKAQIRSKLTKLRAYVVVLETTVALEAEEESASAAASPSNATDSRRVFIVHGRDSATCDAVARFVRKLGLEEIILHEQPNTGLTIIEKFEANTNVAFAVVLLTPDDRGGLATDGYDVQRPRARQNVVLELGYFLSKLGRSRVCALHKGGVELPSDFDGVLYVPIDDGGAWKMKLAQEIKQVISDLDLNKAFGA